MYLLTHISLQRTMSYEELEIDMSKSALQIELGKRKPFDSLEQEVSLNLARTHEGLFQEFAGLFESKGLSGSQYNVLRILRRRAGDGTPCQEIACQMINRM